VHVYVDYQGTRVRLTDERLAHILDHPEMHDMEPKIAQLLADPEQVVESLAIHRRGFIIGSTSGRASGTSIYAW
jgi:hypothetical protein